MYLVGLHIYHKTIHGPYNIKFSQHVMNFHSKNVKKSNEIQRDTSKALGSNPGGVKFPHMSRQDTGPTQPPIQYVPGHSWGKAAGAWL